LGGGIKTENAKVFNELRGINSKFAEHMYNKNRIVEAFAMSNLGGVDILEQPMCGKCEKPGFHTEVEGQPDFNAVYSEEFGDQYDELKKKWYYDNFVINCYCVECGTTTPDTLNLREYLLRELKLPEEIMRKFQNIMYGGK
jgi:hypothetical protein